MKESGKMITLRVKELRNGLAYLSSRECSNWAKNMEQDNIRDSENIVIEEDSKKIYLMGLVK